MRQSGADAADKRPLALRPRRTVTHAARRAGDRLQAAEGKAGNRFFQQRHVLRHRGLGGVEHLAEMGQGEYFVGAAGQDLHHGGHAFVSLDLFHTFLSLTPKKTVPGQNAAGGRIVWPESRPVYHKSTNIQTFFLLNVRFFAPPFVDVYARSPTPFQIRRQNADACFIPGPGTFFLPPPAIYRTAQ